MLLDATPGGANSNSFVTVDEATAYFAARLYASAWTSASSGDKEKALITATQRLNQEEFAGVKASSAQALQWPRYGACDRSGYPYAADTIPQAVRDATCELALELLKSDILAEVETKNLKALRAGPVALEFADQQQSGALPAQVVRLLNHLRLSGGSAIRMVRG